MADKKKKAEAKEARERQRQRDKQMKILIPVVIIIVMLGLGGLGFAAGVFSPGPTSTPFPTLTPVPTIHFETYDEALDKMRAVYANCTPDHPIVFHGRITDYPQGPTGGAWIIPTVMTEDKEVKCFDFNAVLIPSPDLVAGNMRIAWLYKEIEGSELWTALIRQQYQKYEGALINGKVVKFSAASHNQWLVLLDGTALFKTPVQYQRAFMSGSFTYGNSPVQVHVMGDTWTKEELQVINYLSWAGSIYHCGINDIVRAAGWDDVALPEFDNPDVQHERGCDKPQFDQ